MYLLKLSIQIPYKLAGTAGNAHVNGNLYGQGVRFPRRTYTQKFKRNCMSLSTLMATSYDVHISL